MLTSAFKTFGVLYLVMQYIAVPYNPPALTKFELPKTRVSIIDKKIVNVDSPDKKSEYNANKEEIKNVRAAIIHTKPLALSITPDKNRLLPSPTSVYSPTLPQITIIPIREITQIPSPTYEIPEVTIIPIPSPYVPCGCQPVKIDAVEIHCTMNTPDMLCPD